MKADDIIFIADPHLRKKIVNAIDTIAGLFIVERDNKYPAELSKEIRRTIVLYSASIIEALLLYLYKKKSHRYNKVEYIDVYPLPSNLQTNKDYKLVIAKQFNLPREDRELMLDVLLKYYTNKEKIISDELYNKIKKAKDIRNTFHLAKSRTRLVVGKSVVQTTIDAIYETIILVKKNL